MQNNNLKMPIGALADTLEVHRRTLRIYDEEKILVAKRTPKNRRYYLYEDIERGKFILLLTRSLGITLPGVKILDRVLEKNGIKNKTKYISEVIEELGISKEDLLITKNKMMNKGRKPNVSAT